MSDLERPCRHEHPVAAPDKCLTCKFFVEGGHRAHLIRSLSRKQTRPLSRSSLCIHLGEKLDNKSSCIGKCWHVCEEGHGQDSKTRPGIECKSCGWYDPDGPGTPGPQALGQKQQIVVDHGAAGIGDGLLGLTAVAALKEQRPDAAITYRVGSSSVPFVGLFEGYDFLGIRKSTTHEGPIAGALQINAGYRKEFATKHAKPRWTRYAENIGAKNCIIPKLIDKPSIESLGKEFSDCVMLFPFSHEPAREWSIQHWSGLERLLNNRGLQTAVCHSSDSKISLLKSRRLIGASPEHLAGAMLNAKCVVGNDSGPAHLGGILGVKTIVLGGYTPVQQIFGIYPRVICLQGSLPCSGCCAGRPMDSRCRKSCGNLQVISPEQVLDAILDGETKPAFVSETSKHRHLVAPYCQGNGIDLGSSGDPIVPWAIQLDLPNDKYLNYNANRPDTPIHLRGSAESLPFKDQSLAWVHSSHLLEDFADWKPVLREWDRVVQVGGYLIIAVPDHQRFRAAVASGHNGDNLGHKHESHVGELPSLLSNYQTLYDDFVNNDPHEYSVLYIGRKVTA